MDNSDKSQGCTSRCAHGDRRNVAGVASGRWDVGYEVQFNDGSMDIVEGAHAYVQEGALTTFFQGRDGRGILDSWARRLASYRTADIVRVRWREDAAGRAEFRRAMTVTTDGRAEARPTLDTGIEPDGGRQADGSPLLRRGLHHVAQPNGRQVAPS